MPAVKSAAGVKSARIAATKTAAVVNRRVTPASAIAVMSAVIAAAESEVKRHARIPWAVTPVIWIRIRIVVGVVRLAIHVSRRGGGHVNRLARNVSNLWLRGLLNDNLLLRGGLGLRLRRFLRDGNGRLRRFSSRQHRLDHFVRNAFVMKLDDFVGR